jgi:hypothetical protein
MPLRPPQRQYRHRVVVEFTGPKSKKEYQEYTTALRQLLRKYKARISEEILIQQKPK